MKILLIVTAILSPLSLFAQKYPPKDWQIATATLAAPELERENATVIGYDSGGELTVIRQGTNDLICLADDPSRKGFSAACYHKSLEPFMARGRELKKQGKSAEEIFNIREEEAKAGTLEMPEHALLNVLTGQVNEATKEVEKTHLRYVYYIPFATSETTGLPLAPISPGAPWIMNPGTHRAHIMITPPKDK
jgi:hypothetical protein